MHKFHRTLAILLIISLALGAGFLTDLLWNKIEEWGHPQSYDEIVAKYAKEYNIPEYVIYAVIKTESGFDPKARSSANAIGLMQMTPIAHVDTLEVIQDGTVFSDLYDPETNIRHGTCYLQMMYRLFDYDWDLAFAAYNAGPGNVSEWLEDPEYTDSEGNLIKIPFSETKSYVSKVNKAMNTYKNLYYANGGNKS